MATKTIGIDIREATEGGAGKGRYAEEITKALIKAKPNVHFYLFTKKPNKTFPSQKNLTQVVVQGRGLAWHISLRRYLKSHPMDWLISPTSYIPAAIAPKGQKVATVVHDLVAFLFPENNHWFATLVERLTLNAAIKRSQLIITVSKNTWKDLITLKPFAKNRHHTTATPAISKDFRPTNTKNLNLPIRYLLAVGTLQPRKNFKAIFSAFAQVAKRQSDLHLCIVGGEGWKTSKIFKEVPENLADRIHFLGYLKHESLPEIYSRAQMLLFPSLYEGFGIPPLEAMACGCPVVASNTSTIPEVVGDAAIQIDPKNPDDLAEAISTLLGPKMQKMYSVRGQKKAEGYSWQLSAEKILNSL